MFKFLNRIHWLLDFQLGINFKKILHFFIGIRRFLVDFIIFKFSYQGKIEISPCLHDWHEEGGATKSEYFWQDLLVAKKIFIRNPARHLDIGSRVDGFVAHVASFREIEILDIRPISNNIPGVVYKQADLMSQINNVCDLYDSISCLHALEHFGLGRYGDPINPNGHIDGLHNIVKYLKNDGFLYLSVPIGIERVEFNANRVFDPKSILAIANNISLLLHELLIIQDGSSVSVVDINDDNLLELGSKRYALGIFTFRKAPCNAGIPPYQ